MATNTDRTLPTAHGLVPGNGTLVAAVAEATGATPEVVGKPHPPLYRVAAERLGAAANGLLAVGDRLDTDIVGASAVGADSLWVLTGVDGFTHLARSTALSLIHISSLPSGKFFGLGWTRGLSASW